MLDKVRRLVGTSLVYGLGSVASKFVGFFLLPVFTYYLSPGEYGQFESLNVVLLLLSTVSVAGLDAGLARFYYDDQWSTRRSAVIGTATSLAVVIGAVAAAGGFVLLQSVGGSANFESFSPTAVILTFVLVPFVVFNTQILSLLQTRRQPIWHSSITLGRFLLVYGGSVVLLIHGLSVTGIFWAHLGAYCAVGIVGIWMVSIERGWTFDRDAAKVLLRFGAPIAVANIGAWVVSSSDRFFLLRYAGLQEVGIYSVGVRLASVVGLAVAAFQTAWPQFVFSIAHEENLPYTYSRIFTYFALAGTGLAVAVTLLAPEVLSIMTTHEYADAQRVVLLLCCSILLVGVSGTIGIIPSLAKKTVSFLPAVLVPAAVNLAANSVCVPRWGMMGAAWVSVLTSGLMAGIMYLLARQMMPVRYEVRRLFLIGGLGAAVLGAGAILPFEGLAPRLSAKIFLLLASPVVLWHVKFFEPNETTTITDYLHRWFPKLFPASRH